MKYRFNKRLSRLSPALLLLSFGLLLAGTEQSQAQLARPAGSCMLSGADSVKAGAVASYTLDGCTAGSWTVTCGAISDQKPGGVTVNFAVTSCNNLLITATNGGKVLTTKRVTIIAAPTMAAGNITATGGQAVNYGKTPRLLTAPVATGGICGGAYLYQWLSSIDNQTFSAIPQATGKDYQPGPLTVTTWFKRQAACAGLASSVMTSPVKITVNPVLNLSRINPAAQSINADDSVGTLSIGTPSGGSGNFSYQWQKAATSSFAAPVSIGGANSVTYTPVGLKTTTYFRVGVISNGDTSYTYPTVVNIFSSLKGGMISPASQTIDYGAVPSLLSSTGISGGSGNYRYEWYTSADSVNWDLVKGVMTPNYNPGGLEVTTWFRITVICDGLPATSAVAVVHVNPSISGQ